MMDWEAIGAIGEILGAAAVVVTLGFLVSQLRLNNIAIKAQTRSSVTDQVLAMTNHELSSPQLLAAQLKAFSNAPLDATEQRLLYAHIFGWFRQWENVFYQYRHGTLDESEFTAQRASWAGALESPYFQGLWQGIKGGYSPEFVLEIDAILGPDAASSAPQFKPPTFGRPTAE